MRRQPKQDVEDAIECAEKYLDKNDLSGAENKYHLALRYIEAYQKRSLKISNLSALSNRLDAIQAELLRKTSNQDGYSYLSFNLRMVRTRFYSDYGDIIREYETYDQSGKRKTGWRSILTRSTRKRDELKEKLSKIGYLGIRELQELTEKRSSENNKEQQESLDDKIRQEIRKLPETLKPVVESYFKEAKKSSTETKNDSPQLVEPEDSEKEQSLSEPIIPQTSQDNSGRQRPEPVKLEEEDKPAPQKIEPSRTEQEYDDRIKKLNMHSQGTQSKTSTHLGSGTYIMNSYGHIIDKDTGIDRKVDEKTKEQYIWLIGIKDEKKGILLLIDKDNISVASPISYCNFENSRVEEGIGIYVTDRFSTGIKNTLEAAHDAIKKYKGKGPYDEDLVFKDFVVMDKILDKINTAPVNEELVSAVYKQAQNNVPFRADFEGIQAIDSLLKEKMPRKIYIGNNITSINISGRDIIITDVSEGIKAKQIPVTGEIKLFEMNVAFKEIVQDYEAGEIENKKAIEAAGKIIELLNNPSLDAADAAERDRLVEQISNKIESWKQESEQNSNGAVEPKLYCGVCGRELNSDRSCKHCTYTDVTYGHEKNLMDTLLGHSWETDSPERVGAWIIAREFSKLVNSHVISKEDYPKNVAEIDELLQKLSSKQLEEDAHKSLQTIYTTFVENNRIFRNNALGTGNSENVDSNNNHSDGQSSRDAPDEKKNLPEHKKPKLIYLPMYHKTHKDFINCMFSEQVNGLNEEDLCVIEDFRESEKLRNLSGTVYNRISMGEDPEKSMKFSDGRKIMPIECFNEFMQDLVRCIFNKKFSIFVEPSSESAERGLQDFEFNIPKAISAFMTGNLEVCFQYIVAGVQCMAKSVRVRDKLTTEMIEKFCVKAPDKNILVIRGGTHYLYELLHERLHNRYSCKEVVPSIGYHVTQMNELITRVARGDNVSDNEIKLFGFRGIVTQEISCLFYTGCNNETIKTTRKITDSLELEDLYSLSEYISHDPQCQKDKLYGAKKILEFIEGKAPQEPQTYNNPESPSSTEKDPTQKADDENTTLPFAEKEARNGVLANLYASEVLSAKGEH
ncbi:MAG: hypothetical protein KAJ91_01570, partial [Candidatus Aenigmarchaeota archaeon]|nr:hypothetical protein [Candidatus Aenigmarchaeota archaeon]